MALVISGDSPSFSGTYQGGVITSGTAVASTSGTSIDFTSIPSWVKRITVMLNGVSTNGTANVVLQLGAGSVTTSGYFATLGLIYGSTSAVVGTYTNGFNIGAPNLSSDLYYGSFTVTSFGSNAWTGTGNMASTARNCSSSGLIALGGTLDRVRITTGNGTDTFDAGSINILYE